ncbi:MAG: hypothetical protein SFY68_00395 [Candidatus Sumerlaeia bacterium]|nr:hypothetical protein [Candidatus Sumerlaeia bacterium]
MREFSADLWADCKQEVGLQRRENREGFMRKQGRTRLELLLLIDVQPRVRRF